jgi:heavy metal translocating P-type ATPase
MEKQPHPQKPLLYTRSGIQLLLAAMSILTMVLYFLLPSDYALYPIFAVLIMGIPFLLWDIVKGVLKGDFGADILAAIAIITAVWLKEYLAADLLVLMLASGQALEAFAMRKASSVLNALAGRMPAIAHRKRGDTIEDIPLHSLEIGDEVAVYPHEAAPVDGVVVSGQSQMDESYLTGEPYRVAKAEGSSILSGAINGESLLVVRAEKLPQDSRYATIMQVMSEAEQKRPALRRIGDQIGAIFAPVALAVAVLAYFLTGDMDRFLAVLVVATPCPLLIAIPITLISAVSLAAKRGIIIRDPTVLERLPTCTTAIFDKTGTLTYGQPELTEIITPTEDETSKRAILQAVASLERYSKHPLASAILKAAEKAHLFLPPTSRIAETSGQGLLGVVEGKEFLVTSRKKLLQRLPDAESLLPPTAAGLECVVLQDGSYAATLRFRDTPRSNGKRFIDHLAPNHQFNRVMLVSGDRESEVNYLGELLGIAEIRASQSPEQKLVIVREETAKAPTLFMGDGINDAPALTAATVGIAFGQHSSVTSEAAGAVILDNTLSRVDELIHLSEAMRRIALQSAIGGMLCSLIGMGFAAAGYLSPVMGALLQEAIDVLAILNALRLAWHKDLHADV